MAIECATRVALQQEHDQANAIFDETRKRLHQRIGVCPKEEFLSLNNTLDRSWKALQRARAELDTHIRHHSCLTHEAVREAPGLASN